MRAILGRAAAAGTSPALPGPAPGHSLEEIEAAAREAGIDPAAVRRAALTTLPEAPPASLGGRLLGAPLRQGHRLVLPGRLDEAAAARLGPALASAVGREMARSEEKGWTVWEEDHRQGRTRVALREADGGVEVELEADEAGWTTIHGLLGAGVGTAGALALGAPLPALLPVLLALSVVGGVWAARRAQLRNGRLVRERLGRAAMAVAEAVEGDV